MQLFAKLLLCIIILIKIISIISDALIVETNRLSFIVNNKLNCCRTAVTTRKRDFTQTLKYKNVLLSSSSSSAFQAIRKSGNNTSNTNLIKIQKQQRRVFIFGLGYVGKALALSLAKKGWKVAGTCRNLEEEAFFKKNGISAVCLSSQDDMILLNEEAKNMLNLSPFILSSIPPLRRKFSNENGGDDQQIQDPVLNNHYILDILSRKNWSLKTKTHDNNNNNNNNNDNHNTNIINNRWIGYLSSTGVYEEMNGNWVTEKDSVFPHTLTAQARVICENKWKDLYEKTNIPIHIFRLAGIYGPGPGRSALETIKNRGLSILSTNHNDRNENLSRFISRIHVEDIVEGLIASMNHPYPGTIYNFADDKPSSRHDVLLYAAKLFLSHNYIRLFLSYNNNTTTDTNIDNNNNNNNNTSKNISNDRSKSSSRQGNKRVDNSRLKLLLSMCGNSLKYPTYEAGLKDLYLN